MPKSEGQKLKLLYLADLLRRETDEDHALSMSDILSRSGGTGRARRAQKHLR